MVVLLSLVIAGYRAEPFPLPAFLKQPLSPFPASAHYQLAILKDLLALGSLSSACVLAVYHIICKFRRSEEIKATVK